MWWLLLRRSAVDQKTTDRLNAAVDDLASQGLRTLCLAYKDIPVRLLDNLLLVSTLVSVYCFSGIRKFLPTKWTSPSLAASRCSALLESRTLSE